MPTPNSEEPLVPDLAGILSLPAGFSYRVMVHAGRRTELGYTKPDQFDGMASFAGPKGQGVRVRNHELDPSQTAMKPFQNRWPEPTTPRAPDGKTLFVNIQKPSLTLAITGPWKT